MLLFWLRVSPLVALVCGGLLLLTLAGVAPNVPIRDVLAFTRFNADSNRYEIAMFDPARNALITLQEEPYQSFYGWSADGRFVFLSDTEGSTEVYLWDGLSTHNLSQHPMNDWRPAISPDGRVAFASERDGNMEIYIWDDGELSNLSQHPAMDDYPAWSADGRLAFVSSRDSASLIEDIIVWDGAGFTNITRTPDVAELFPAWSPDGQLAFYAHAGDTVMLRVWDGEQVFDVTPGGGYYAPQWSVNGWLVFEGYAHIVHIWNGATIITYQPGGPFQHLAWRADGTLTAVIRSAGAGVRLVRLEDTQMHVLLQAENIQYPVWSP